MDSIHIGCCVKSNLSNDRNHEDEVLQHHNSSLQSKSFHRKMGFFVSPERFICILGPIRRKNLTVEILKNSRQHWVSKKHLPLKETWVLQCRSPIHSEAETQSFEVQRNVFWVFLEKSCCFPLRFVLAEVLLALSVWNQWLQNFSPLDPLQHLSPPHA